MKFRLPQKATQWALLGGFAYVLCFPRFDLPALAVLVLPCLIYSIQALESRRQAWRLGFLVSSMIAVGGFHWIVYVARNFGEMPLPAAVGLLGLFCLVAAPQMVAFFVLGERLRGRVERLPPALRPLFWASLYTGLEYLAHFFKIFPENLGNTWLAFLPVAQLASLGGVPLLSFVPLWVGGSLAYLRKCGRRAWPGVAASVALLALAFFWGKSELKRLETVPTSTLHIGFVQHNLDDAEKAFQRTSAREMIETIVGRLLAKTEDLARRTPKPDLVLWPETAYPMVFHSRGGHRLGTFSEGYANLVKRTVARAGVPLLFGGYESEGGEYGFSELDYNAGILLDANGGILTTYRKQVLLIFGEYFPFSDWFPALKDLNPMLGDFGRGPGPIPLKFTQGGRELPLGVNICYEAILPEYMRGFALAGARLFVNLTKDSWFGDTFEPWQHFQLSVPRAIEHRIPMVRATNTGLSGLVLPSGETKLLSVPFREAYAVVDVPVPLDPRPTPYTLFGEWFAWLMLATASILTLWTYRR
jgi:apolipoprotein N-acyltransferase